MILEEGTYNTKISAAKVAVIIRPQKYEGPVPREDYHILDKGAVACGEWNNF